MKCQNCESERIIRVAAKCSDLCHVSDEKNREHFGYVPRNLGIGGGDYLDFEYCCQCGKIQDEDVFPIDQEIIDEVLK